MKIDYVAWVAVFIALAGLFWNVNTGFNRVHERMDRLQAETNRRFDTMQAENQRQHDAIEEVLRIWAAREGPAPLWRVASVVPAFALNHEGEKFMPA